MQPGVHCSTVYNSPRRRSNLNVHQQRNEKGGCGTYIPWTITQPLKKNEIMPFAGTWMDLEIIILSKPERERQISYDITYIWNHFFFKNKNELIYKKEIDSQIQKTNLWIPKGRGEKDKLGVWD